MTQENQPIRPKEILLGLPKGGECFFPKEKEDSAKSVASKLKRKGLAQFKTKLTENGILITRIL